MISATIFLSAFLLFLVQPIIAKLILPQFGGGAAVWATCLVFFQATLLLGYAYAHQVVKRDHAGTLRLVHIALLGASLLVLPIIPRGAWPSLAGTPGWQILALLVVTIGAPFALLASTSPLLQAWIAQARCARSVSPVRDLQPRIAGGAAGVPVADRAVARQHACRPSCGRSCMRSMWCWHRWRPSAARSVRAGTRPSGRPHRAPLRAHWPRLAHDGCWAGSRCRRWPATNWWR